MWLSVHYARSFAIAQAQMGPKSVSVIWNSRVSDVEGVLNVLKSMETRSRHSEMSIIMQVSVIEGCLLSGVPLYSLYYTCNKYCYLIGHSEVSISHRDVQVFIATYKFSIETYKFSNYWEQLG